jgi:serine/threonine-protein kinase RsbW
MEYLETFRSYVLEKAEKWGIDQETLFKIELVLEELLTNVIRYAYVDGGSGDVEVECSFQRDNRFYLSIQDWGKPFDPLQREDPDLTKGVNEREIGGLGIHLVRQMADQVSYNREENSNKVHLCFQISTVCT